MHNLVLKSLQFLAKKWQPVHSIFLATVARHFFFDHSAYHHLSVNYILYQESVIADSRKLLIISLIFANRLKVPRSKLLHILALFDNKNT